MPSIFSAPLNNPTRPQNTNKPAENTPVDKSSFANTSDFAKASSDKTADRPVQKTQSPQFKQTAPSSSAEATKNKPTDRPTSPQAKPDHQPVKPRVQNKLENTPEKTQPVKVAASWNDTMVTTTHNWLKQTLSLMGLPSVNFNSEVAGKNLKLTFENPLIADPMQEKQLFRSFAHLIMSSLRNQYKQEIKNLKVILIRPE
jgi:hypothetical protein